MYTGWQRRWVEDEEHRRTLLVQARRAAQECARCLYEVYGARRVYLFGSVVEETAFHERSDLDLAVEGLPASRYFQALADLWKRLPPGMELDLIPLEDAHPELRELVIYRRTMEITERTEEVVFRAFGAVPFNDVPQAQFDFSLSIVMMGAYEEISRDAGCLLRDVCAASSQRGRATCSSPFRDVQTPP